VAELLRAAVQIRAAKKQWKEAAANPMRLGR